MTKLTIETDRLILRPFQNSDYEQWSTGFDNRMPSTYKYDDGYEDSSHYTKKWFIDWIKGFQETAEKDDVYILGIFRKEDGANIGNIEVIKILRQDYDWAMMGYSIHNQFFRQGYGKESVQAATELFFAELNFHRIELQINIDNEPSRKLAESAGFQFECVRKDFFYEGGKWIDQLIYYKNRKNSW